MPFHFSSEPVGGADLIRARLEHMNGRRLPLTQVVVNSDALLVKPAYAIHLITDFQLLATEGNWNSVLSSGFRYLIEHNAKVAASADVCKDGQGDLRLVNIGYGPMIKLAANALDQLNKHEQLSADTYEASVVSCREMRLLAVWLKSSAQDNTDLIYRIDVSGSPLEDQLPAGKLHPLDDFIVGIQPHAQSIASLIKNTSKPTV